MSVTNFIPEVWNAAFLTAIDDILTLAQPGVTVNTNYEGDVANAGDTVHIGQIGRPTVKTYVPNVTVITPDQIDLTDQTLVVDQSKYFAFGVDDVDKRQVLGGGNLMNLSAIEAAKAVALVQDTFVGQRMVTGAGTVLPAKSFASTATDNSGIYGVLAKLKGVFDKKKLPMTGRWFAADPDAINALYFDPRFISAEKYGSTQPIQNGEIGSILGFRIISHSNAPLGATAAGANNDRSRFAVAGVGSEATTWVSQIGKTEAYRPESSFSDAIKGLNVYGAKVVRPEFLAAVDLTVTG